MLFVGCAKNSDPLSKYRSKTEQQIYFEAQKNLAKHNYSNTIKSLEALDALYPFGVHAQQGQLDIIYAYFMNDNTVSSIAAAERYERLYPRDNHVDYAYFMEGIANIKQSGNWLQRSLKVDPAPRDTKYLKEAYQQFNVIALQYPDSYYAPFAARYMIYARNAIARHILAIADYYYDNQIYLGAANRASFIVQHFSSTPQAIMALVLMVKSYERLGLDNMALQSYLVLQANAPHFIERHHLSLPRVKV